MNPTTDTNAATPSRQDAERIENVLASGIIDAAIEVHRSLGGPGLLESFLILGRSFFAILHIADPTAESIRKTEIKKVGLLGTKVTMEEEFYKDRLQDRYGITTLIPKANDRANDRESLHKIIFDELTVGQIHNASKKS